LQDNESNQGDSRKDYGLINKAEVGRRLALVNDKIQEKSSKISHSSSIVLLLCLEDAIESSLIDGMRQIQIGTLLLDRKTLMMIQKFFVELFREFNECVSLISQNGIKHDVTPKLPEIFFELYLQQSFEECIRGLINEGIIDKRSRKNDVIYHREIAADSSVGGFIVGLQKGTSSNKTNLLKILELRELIYSRKILDDLLRTPFGTRAKFDKNGNLIDVLTPTNSLEEEIEGAVRSFHTISFVPDWNSDFREITSKTLSSETPLAKSLENNEQVKKELNAISDAFQTIEGFSIEFQKHLKISYAIFSKIITEITLLTLESKYNVILYEKLKLIKLLGKKTRISTHKIVRVIQLLLESKEMKEIRCNAFLINGYFFVNFHRLNKALYIFSEDFFTTYYDDSMKGFPFENSCRKFFEKNGFSTIPRRLEIFEQILPTDVSLNLWKKVKKRTDIDGLCWKDNIIFVLECKDNIMSTNKEKIKVIKNSAIENYYKAVWLANNREKLQDYIGNTMGETLSKKPLFFIPLLITSKAVNVDLAINQPMTYVELKEINLQDFSKLVTSAEKEGTMEVTTTGKKFILPWIVSEIGK
jgi:hypothetical protein